MGDKCPNCESELQECVVTENVEGYGAGDTVYKCDKCKKIYRGCEVWSRIVGYLRPTNDWNAGKKAEFPIRTTYTNLKEEK